MVVTGTKTNIALATEFLTLPLNPSDIKINTEKTKNGAT